MKQITFYSFEELLDFFRYIESGVNITYVNQSADSITIEISEQDWNSGKTEYEADTYTNYEYI